MEAGVQIEEMPELEGQLTKSLLYFLVGSVSIDTEHFIMVTFLWHPFSTSPPVSPLLQLGAHL